MKTVAHVERLHYPQPRAAESRKRVIHTNCGDHNRTVLSNQVRVSSGATFCTGGRVLVTPGRVVRPHLEATPAADPARTQAEMRFAKLLNLLTECALEGDCLPFLPDMADPVGLEYTQVLPALEKLHAVGLIQLQTSPHRPGFKRQLRVEITGYGVANTPGWAEAA